MLQELMYIIMMKNRIILAVLMISMLSCPSLFAKKPKGTGNEIWTGTDFKLPLYSKLDLEYAQEFRFETDGKRNRCMYSDLGLRYEVFNKFKIGAAYRARIKNEVNRNELYAHVMYEIDLKPFEIDLRLRLHKKIEDDDTEIDYLRCKAAVSYKISKLLSCGAQAELFNRLGVTDYDRLEKGRYGLSADIRLSKNIDLGINWLYEDEMTGEKQRDTKIYGFYLSFNL